MAVLTDAECVRPYAEMLSRVGLEEGFDPWLLAGIGLRESRFGHAPRYEPKGSVCGWGDEGNGFGLFQIDRRWHGPFLATPEAGTAEGQCRYACRILRLNRTDITRRYPSLDTQLAYRAMIAAYNCGAGGVFRSLKCLRDVDSGTTAGNYSGWVLDRIAALHANYPDLLSAR